MAYTTQENVEDYLGRSLTDSEENYFPTLLETVEGLINDLIGGGFGTVTESTRYYDGGSKIIDIDPCIEVSSIELIEEDETVTYTYFVDEYEFRPRNDTVKKWVELRSGKFPKGVANLAVTAKFTMGDVPADIEYLTDYLISRFLSSTVKEGITQEAIEGYSRTFRAKVQDEVVNQIIDKYKTNDIL
jgi:hypothetical protein